MTNDNFGFGFTCGFILAAVIFTGFATYIRDRGRDECEQSLPRQQSCVQKWVPPSLKEPSNDQ